MIEPELEARVVQRWEAGKGFPSGDRLLKMLRQCKDKKSLLEFGIDIAHGGEQYPSEQIPHKGKDLVDTSPVARKRQDGRLIGKHQKTTMPK